VEPAGIVTDDVGVNVPPPVAVNVTDTGVVARFGSAFPYGSSPRTIFSSVTALTSRFGGQTEKVSGTFVAFTVMARVPRCRPPASVTASSVGSAAKRVMGAVPTPPEKFTVAGYAGAVPLGEGAGPPNVRVLVPE
jgi:hypothetical protein